MYYLCTAVLSQFSWCPVLPVHTSIESIFVVVILSQFCVLVVHNSIIESVRFVSVLAAVHNTVLSQSGLYTTCAQQYWVSSVCVYYLCTNDSTVLNQLCVLLSVFGAGGAGGADERGAQRECGTRHGQTLLLPARPLPQLLQTVHRRRWAHHHQAVSCWDMDEKNCYKISQSLLFMLIRCMEICLWHIGSRSYISNK